MENFEPTHASKEQLKKEILTKIGAFDIPAIQREITAVVSAMSSLSTEEKKTMHRELNHAILGYDVIQPYLDDPSVTEIMINGLTPIFIEKKGKLHQTAITFESKTQLMQLIHKISNETGREVNLGNPTLDARLKDGSRVNIILDPVALTGPHVTIRKFKKNFNSAGELMQTGMFDINILKLFEVLAYCKYNLFIAGGTGSGKTTLLNCIAGLVPEDERIITIEDAAEINLPTRKNIVSMETRKGHSGTFDIDMSHLIKNALRMRPDRIIVGEVRGEEVIDMLQAMNTGHDGSMSTGHSNTPLDMLTRLEVIASSHTDIHHSLIRRQIISAIDFIIFVEKMPDGQRRVTKIQEVDKTASDYVLFPLYEYTGATPASTATLKGHIKQDERLKRFSSDEKV